MSIKFIFFSRVTRSSPSFGMAVKFNGWVQAVNSTEPRECHDNAACVASVPRERCHSAVRVLPQCHESVLSCATTVQVEFG